MGDAKREVAEVDVESLRDLVQALLELECGIDNPERRESLRRRAGISAPGVSSAPRLPSDKPARHCDPVIVEAGLL